jgi:hypothetical protein
VEIAHDAQAVDGRVDERVRGGAAPSAGLCPEAVRAVEHGDELAALRDGTVRVVAEHGDDGGLGAEALEVVELVCVGVVDHLGMRAAAAPERLAHQLPRALLVEGVGEHGVVHGRLDATGPAVEGGGGDSGGGGGGGGDGSGEDGGGEAGGGEGAGGGIGAGGGEGAVGDDLELALVLVVQELGHVEEE